MIQMNSTGVNKFPFKNYSDEELQESVEYCLREIQTLITTREFDVHIITMGQTLVDLEKEQDLRKIKH